MTHCRSDLGAVAITVAISLVVLLGFVALSIDGGVASNERRTTQNAPDHAALAAAWAECNGQDPFQAGLESAATNGYAGGVVITETGQNTFLAQVMSVAEAQFGVVIGTGSVAVLSEAEATCTLVHGLGGYAIFANAPAGCVPFTTEEDTELDFAGATKDIHGGIHGNGDLKVRGSSTTITGGISYVGDETAFKPGEYDPEPLQTGNVDLPIFGLSVGDFLGLHDEIDAMGASINNNWLQSQGYGEVGGGSIVITTPGVYYTSGDIELNNVRLGEPAATAGVTFVANGRMHIRGEGNMTAYDGVYGLLAFSDYGNRTCTLDEEDFAVKWSVSNGTFTGTILAANGLAIQAGSTINAIVTGSIYGHQVNLAGSNYTINYPGGPGSAAQHQVELLR